MRYVVRNTFLRLTLDLGVASDQHGNVSTRVKRYQGEWKPSVLADYRWDLKCDFPQAKYNRSRLLGKHRGHVVVWKFTCLLQCNCVT